MCGIAGFFGGELADHKTSNSILEKMINRIISRGPDSKGLWLNSSNRVGFGHRRLAVVDLSSAGHQPMSIDNNNYTIAYNGEIYNHLELRVLLEKEFTSISWLGTSDTETLLVAFNSWGIEKTLKKIVYV